MFLNKRWGLHSVRFRIVCYYLFSSLLVLILCATGLLYSIHRKFNRDMDDKLRYFRDEFEYEYLSGREELVGATRITRHAPGYPSDAIFMLKLSDGSYSCIVTNSAGVRTERRYQPDKVTLISELSCPTNTIEFMRIVFTEESHGEGLTKLFLLLSDQQGHVLARSAFDDAILHAMMAAQAPNRRPRDIHVHASDQGAVAIRQISTELPPGAILTIGYNFNSYEAYLFTVGSYLLMALIGSTLLGVFFGSILARKFTRSLDAIAATARAIEAGDTSIRVKPSEDGTEIRLLTDAFNNMCDANEKMMRELRMISDNIAHDLRTPLTRMRGQAELAITNSQAAEHLAGDISEDCMCMLDMINTMLAITQTSYSIEQSRRETLDLAALASQIAILYQTSAEDRSITFETMIPKQPLPFSGHASKLQQLLGNLLDNAIKFTPNGGHIQLRVSEMPTGTIEIAVSDTGCGIAPADIPLIFNRFYRADTSRSLPGNGLGLALVQAIVTAYGGKIMVDSIVGKGSTFTVKLPSDLKN